MMGSSGTLHSPSQSAWFLLFEMSTEVLLPSMLGAPEGPPAWMATVSQTALPDVTGNAGRVKGDLLVQPIVGRSGRVRHVKVWRARERKCELSVNVPDKEKRRMMGSSGTPPSPSRSAWLLPFQMSTEVRQPSGRERVPLPQNQPRVSRLGQSEINPGGVNSRCQRAQRKLIVKLANEPTCPNSSPKSHFK